MPLSKQRMRARKRADRAKIGFDGEIVKPKCLPIQPVIQPRPAQYAQLLSAPELDADGAPIPDYY